MPPVSRTIGPLHFEDLEPHRFEDLVRQLAYGFRSWRLLEPTGRLGADEGIDIRGIELLPQSGNERPEPYSDSDDDPPPDLLEREWVIQCKRERSITPARINGILKAALQNRTVHGFILAAACDFSLKTRAAFRRESVAFGAQEFYMWGKADLEDMLFRPENDHLLFAYFGVSLVVRRRDARTSLRAFLAAKRKAVRVFGSGRGDTWAEVLVRSVDEKIGYPSQADQPALMRVLMLRGHEPEGLRFELGRFAAFLSDDREQWDAALAMKQRTWGQTPWLSDDEQESRIEEYNAIAEVWNSFPEPNQAWLVIERLLRYERIVDIDIEGDRIASMPHVFIDDTPPGAWAPWEWSYLQPTGQTWGTVGCDDAKRIAKFPEQYRQYPRA